MATELAVMLVLRTRRPFYRSRPGTLLLVSSFAVALVTLVLPYTPLASMFGLTPIPPLVLLALAAITTGYVVVTEAVKWHMYRRVPRALR